MEALVVVAASAVGGLVLGSFINVLASRVPEGRSIVRPGSRCPNCLAKIRAVDNVPIASYLLLRGRCRACGTPISLRYPLTEAVTGVIFAVVVWRLVLVEHRAASGLFALAVSAVAITVAVVDLETRRIPRSIIYWGAVLVVPAGIVAAFIEARAGSVWVGMAGSLGLGLGFFLIHEGNPRWMGFGDVRYAFFLGWALGVLGAVKIIVGLMVSLASGSLVGLILIALGKKKFGQALPFGPFLSLGTLVAILWGQELATWYTRILTGAVAP